MLVIYERYRPYEVQQKYCTEAGMSPLVSEWRHFNNWEDTKEIDKANVSGQFYQEDHLGVKP